MSYCGIIRNYYSLQYNNQLTQTVLLEELCKIDAVITILSTDPVMVTQINDVKLSTHSACKFSHRKIDRLLEHYAMVCRPLTDKRINRHYSHYIGIRYLS